MKTNLLNVVGCLALSMGAVIAGVEPAFSQQDEGVQAVLDAQADSAPLPPLWLTMLKLSSATGLRAKAG